MVKNLSLKQLKRLQKAKYHFNGLVEALFPPLVVPPVVTDSRALFRLEGESAIRIARSYMKIPTDHEREVLKRSFMEKAMFDEGFGKVLETRYLKSLIGGQGIYYCALAAARYAHGEVEEAIALFESAIQTNPTPFNYLCLSRCASHGLNDDKRAVATLNTALQKFPADFSLILSMAAAHFRLGNAKRANEYLDSISKELTTVVRASELGIERLEAEIQTALSQKLTVRPKHPSLAAYTDDVIETYWNQLWYHMNRLNRFQHGWAGLLHRYHQQIGKILTQTAPPIRTVINFGVLCAESDYHLSKKFPDTTFIGVDRDTLTKELNDKAYQSPNLCFLAANIMDVLPDLTRKGNPSLLFHARTASLCYPEFLRNLYRTCAALGIEYIALWENNSLSRTTLRFHDFEDMPADSTAYSQIMLIHNYKKFLEEAGYRVIEVERATSTMDLCEARETLGDGHIFLIAKLS